MTTGNILILTFIIVVFVFIVGFILTAIPSLKKLLSTRPFEFSAAVFLISGLLIMIGECLFY